MEDFVSFEIATKLKEKGFSEECLAYYTTEYTLYNNVITLTDDKYWHVSDIDYEEFLVSHNSIKHTNGNYVDAPTISQVLKWLREEKKLHIEFVGNACGYLYIVSDTPSEGGTDRYCSDYSGPNAGGTWDKYEDCALNAIQYVIDNLI